MQTTMYPWTAGAWQQLLERRENLPQALLIYGPRGVGKLHLARRFAQLTLCETAGVEQPCGRCDACRWFQAGHHPDFRQVEPESMAAPQEPAEDSPAASKGAKPSQEIKVDQVRDLAGFLNIGSHRGKRRLALFHPAEEMNANAANGLLKSLEEPASGACLILVSHNQARLLPTILSRCIRLPLGIPEATESLAWLQQEQVADAAQWLAFAGGAPLLAREYATSGRGERIGQLMALLRQDNRDALMAWPATEREHVEILAEVLQKWAYDQSFGGFSGKGKFFRQIGGPSVMDSRRRVAWLRFAREAGRFRVAARHPLNAKLLAADLISSMPK